jgi:hypothetical protein
VGIKVTCKQWSFGVDDFVGRKQQGLLMPSCGNDYSATRLAPIGSTEQSISQTLQLLLISYTATTNNNQEALAFQMLPKFNC